MQVPRVRLTMRMMMALVAVVALYCYADIVYQRFSDARQQAFRHSLMESELHHYAGWDAVDRLSTSGAGGKAIELLENMTESLKRPHEVWKANPQDTAGLKAIMEKWESRIEREVQLARASMERGGVEKSVKDEWERQDKLRLGQLRLADYHGAMSRKYEHATRHPWLIVPPDPPIPEDLQIHTIPTSFVHSRDWVVDFVVGSFFVSFICILFSVAQRKHAKQRLAQVSPRSDAATGSAS